MQTHVLHNGISINLEMNTPPTELKDGTWFHPARIMNHVRLADLDKLVGLSLWDEVVTNVSPTVAKDNQSCQVVGLILKSKKW